MFRRPLLTGLVLSALAGCAAPPAPEEEIAAPRAFQRGIERDSQGRCIGRVTTPAVIETQTAQVLEQPAETDAEGTVTRPARYRTVTRQRILRDRQDRSFEAICPEQLTPRFLASLQRALAARGLYEGRADGRTDAALVRAVRERQLREGGPDTTLLARRTAVELGLVAMSPEELAAEEEQA